MITQMKNKHLYFCKKCKRKTEHIKCGFGNVGGLLGNCRIECRKCGAVNKKGVENIKV
jgi:hypothetical protein